jgi:hypothetical protein
MENAVCEGAYYRHYEGGLYMVKHIGINSETLQKLVVCQDAGGVEIWIRPMDMFLSTVKVGAIEVPRFKLQAPSRKEGH